MDRAAAILRDHPAGPVTIIADEFASRLDRLTAVCLARTLRTWLDREHARGRRLRVALATTRDDLASALRPETTASVRSGGAVDVDPSPAVSAPAEPAAHITIEPGLMTDYHRLSHLHYRAGPPARPARILVARVTGFAEPVGVLTVSMPPLNGPWRELAWPGRYRSGSKTADARRLNDEVRIISRVIVDARCRGIGVARSLVATYLAAALTPATEALSAMGRVSPFFVRAGMAPYPVPVSRRDARLDDALNHAGLRPLDLLDPTRAAARIERLLWLERELRSWAAAARATRPISHHTLDALCRAAAPALASRPIAYIHRRATDGPAPPQPAYTPEPFSHSSR